jgi:hypothetical protein
MSRQAFAVMAAAIILTSGVACRAALAEPPSAAASVGGATKALDLVQKAQYFWDGNEYCWYDDGWNGPGWYVCNYGPWISGLWWGGPLGWHHWRWHGPVFRGGHAFHPGPTFHGRPAFRGGPAFHGGPAFRGGARGMRGGMHGGSGGHGHR